MSTKWCRFQAGDKVSYGRIEDDSVVAVDGVPWGANKATATRHKLSAVKLLIPTMPSTFFCVGINYRDHIIQAAKRRGVEPQFPQRPDIGYRANNALCAHEDPIVKPKDSGEVFQYRGRARRGDRQAGQEDSAGQGARLRVRLDHRQRRQRAHLAARRPHHVAGEERGQLQADGTVDRHRTSTTAR